MSDKPCLIAVGAHAADMEFTAGAALLKQARQEWDTHIIHLTLGEKGHASLTAEEYGMQKREEAEAAAKLLGATPHFMAFRDAEIKLDDDSASRLARLFRRLRPNVVITHWSSSLHDDHITAHHLTRRALFIAANRAFVLEASQAIRWPGLYYAENWEDAAHFRPYVYVDVSEVFADWEQAFKCYAIGRGEGDYPYWDRYEAQTRIRGIEVGATRAQAFAVDEEGWRQKRELL